MERRTDISGRAWATVEHTRAGDWLEADGGFTCLGDGDTVQVCEAKDGRLFVPCRCGEHGLDGQLDEGGAVYVGLYPIKAPS